MACSVCSETRCVVVTYRIWNYKTSYKQSHFTLEICLYLFFKREKLVARSVRFEVWRREESFLSCPENPTELIRVNASACKSETQLNTFDYTLLNENPAW